MQIQLKSNMFGNQAESAKTLGAKTSSSLQELLNELHNALDKSTELTHVLTEKTLPVRLEVPSLDNAKNEEPHHMCEIEGIVYQAIQRIKFDTSMKSHIVNTLRI